MKSESIDLGPILQSLNLVTWEYDASGELRRHGPISSEIAHRFPVLCADSLQLGTQFRFLSAFLDLARELWEEGDSPNALASGTWEEADQEAATAPFCAYALVTDNGQRFLVLELLGAAYEDKRAILQVAREGSLAYAELQRAQEALQESEARQQQLIADLDARVRERTLALHEANERLSREIEGHLRTQDALLGHQKELRDLADSLVLAEEKERRRIAVGLHDDLGQALAMANIKLGQLAAEQPDLVAEVGEVRLLLRKAITRTRTLTFELSSPILHELGLDAALENLVQQFGARADIVTHYESDDPRQVPEKHAIIMYQAVRELLHNVQKHAAASEVSVSCAWSATDLAVSVADDGRGLTGDTGGLRDSFGLFNVQQRMDHLGGSFLLESAPERGTKVTLRMPLAEGGSNESSQSSGGDA